MTTAVVERRFTSVCDATEEFFEREAERVANACMDIAQRFARGGRLLVFGEHAQATDATHVAVEFVHPVIVGKRALPALALSPGGDGVSEFAAAIRTLGRPQDIAMAISRDAGSAAVRDALVAAREQGLLTLQLAGGVSGEATAARWSFLVPSGDAMIVQEVHETLYHVLWELVHVFFDQQLA